MIEDQIIRVNAKLPKHLQSTQNWSWWRFVL